MLYSLLYPLHTDYSIFNVFRYITFRAGYAAMTALVISFIVGPWLIRRLREMQIGQSIREEGPALHKEKAGTPTMGGLMILVSALGSSLLWMDIGNRYVWLALFALVAFGIIGFLDDSIKYVRKHSMGLAPRYKFVLQSLAALVIMSALFSFPDFSTRLSLPFFKDFRPDLGWAYITFGVLVIVGASNAVNLTDGLDGLAMGPVTVAAAAYIIVTYITGNRIFSDYLLIPYIEGAGEMAIVCGALLGAGLGFLWYNAYPALVFMGDVGSLPLGGAIGYAARKHKTTNTKLTIPTHPVARPSMPSVRLTALLVAVMTSTVITIKPKYPNTKPFL